MASPYLASLKSRCNRDVGKLIRRRIAGKNGQRPFRYFDKGNMAVVGKGFAVMQSGKFKMSGFLAWLAWAAVHLEFLAQPGLRISVCAMDLDFCHRATRLPIDSGSHPDRADEVNTIDGSFNCTRISTTRHGGGFKQMNSPYEQTQ
jgi:hypothetical protein